MSLIASDKVIKQDIVQITYEVDKNPLTEMIKQIKEFKESVIGALTDTEDGLTDLIESAGELSDEIENIDIENIEGLDDSIRETGRNANEITREIRNMNDNINETDSPKKLESGLLKIKDILSGLVFKAGKFTSILGKSVVKGIGKVAKGAAAGITAASVVAGAGAFTSISAGMDFEASMSQVAATAGITKQSEEYKLLADTAKEMGRTTQFSATEAAEALNYLALAGYDAKKASTALPTILNLAAAGCMDLAAASDMITDSMSALGIETTQEELNKFGDQMAKTAQKSNTSVSQLGDAILTVGGTAKDLKGGTTELNALLGILADNSIKGAEGGTALRNVLLALQSPIDSKAKVLKDLGVSAYDANGKVLGINEVLKNLNKSMESMTISERKHTLSSIFNASDLRAVEALLENCGGRFDELSGYIDDSAGAMQEMADTMNDNLKGEITAFNSALEGTQIAIFESLGNGNIRNIIKEASGWLGELTIATENGGIEQLAEVFGSVLAKAIMKISELLPKLINSGVSIIEGFIKGINENLPQITHGAVKAITAFISGISSVIPEIITAGLDIIISLGNGIAENVDIIIETAGKAVEKLLEGLIAKMPQVIRVGVKILTSLAESISQQLPTLIPLAVQAILTIAQGLIENLPMIIQAGIQLIMAFTEGLINMMPILIPMAVNMLITLIEGLVNNLPMLIDAAIQLVVSLVKALIENYPLLLQAGIQLMIALVVGLIKAIPELIKVGPMLYKTLVETIINTDWANVGLEIIKGIKNGITGGLSGLFGGSEKDAISGFASSLQANSSKVSTAVNNISLTTVKGLELDTSKIYNYGFEGIISLSNSINENKNLTDTASLEVKEGIMNNIDSIDLTSSGANAMKGFNNGMLSQKANILTTAKDIANEVKNATNQALDIHSPSRELAKTGMYTGQGFIIGLNKTLPDIKESAYTLGNEFKYSADKNKYTPENGSASVSNNSVNENNNYSPAFNFYITGDVNDKNTKTKIKSLVKEAVKEIFDSIGRKNPPVQEV